MMKRTGVFYEVGGYGAYAGYLCDRLWREYNREKSDAERVIPIEYENEYDRWDVYLVEPLARNMALLQNDWMPHYPNLKLVQVAVGGANSFERIDVVDIGKYRDAKYGHDHTASIKKTNLFIHELQPDSEFYTHVVTLDTLFQLLNAWPSVLRIDIEGAEVDALNAYSFNPRPRIIQVDAHQINRVACANILRAHGYKIVSDAWGDYKDDVYAEDSLQ